ncbi:hypothetical protein CFB89_33275 [Burkholderia sp. AU16741]|nr:hypothetical protein CFB89_33275 [Burkholderia sp. AU16741]
MPTAAVGPSAPSIRRPARPGCGAASGSAARFGSTDRAVYGELDTPATLLYCSAQFAPDRRVPVLPAPRPHGGAT